MKQVVQTAATNQGNSHIRISLHAVFTQTSKKRSHVGEVEWVLKCNRAVSHPSVLGRDQRGPAVSALYKARVGTLDCGFK